MGDEWRYIPFTEAVEVNPKISLTRGAVYPFVDMKAVDPSRRGVTESGFREFKGGGTRFLPFDTLMARITPCLENGKIARYEPSPGITGPAFGSTEFIIIRGKEGVTDNDYAYYLTQWDKFRHFAISQMTGSSGRQRVPADSLSKFMAPVPTLPEQRAIAYILGTLDNKIELNRKMNQTLEAMAQAIFKSWFVDFDPVIDNTLKAGKPIPDSLAKRAAKRKQVLEKVRQNNYPPLPKEIADLFPDEFEDSEIGPIPEGWGAGPFTKIATLTTKTVRPGECPDRFWEHYSIPAFDEGCHPKWERGDTIKSGKYQVLPSCVLASKLNPQFPRVWMPDVADPTVAICSTEFMPFVPVHEQWRPFLYELLKSPTIQEEICSRATGSTGSRQRVKPKDIAIMSVILPPPKVITAFCTIVGGLHKKLLANQRNSFLLARIRDTLLPRLLSGEIEIEATEAFVGRDN